MSVKFLPFITDTSSPLAVFKSLVQRSKGLSNKEITAIYNAVLTLGVEEVKERVSKFTPETPPNEVYHKLADHYADMAVSTNKIAFTENLINFCTDKRLKDTSSYSLQEYACMLSTLIFNHQGKVKTLGLEDLDFERISVVEYLDRPVDYAVSSLLYCRFTKEGTRTGFYSRAEFYAFVFFQEFVVEQPVSILPVAMEEGQDYTNRYAISPLMVGAD
ncbi:hypothetical protein vBAmePPT11V19_00047 [Alteromonas phage vB_AmeP_PT11-V19]|nr:hypothetical protein vBAmePPT11V19_00047 [Alteromonas phage vB_AmeP_PT11-V19]